MMAWCGEDLVEHLCMVAVAASAAYRQDWRVVAGRLGLGESLLPAAALAHDVGKAVLAIQRDAAVKCKRNSTPNYYGHEYASLVAILSTSRDFLERRLARRDPLLVVALAALLHHHGMGRLEAPMDNMRIGPEGLHLYLGDLTIEDLEPLLDAYRKAGEAYNRVAKDLGLPRVEGVLADPGKPAMGARQVLARAVYANPPLLKVDTHARYPWLSAAFPLSGMVAVADSLVSGMARSGKPRGYAVRVLREHGSLCRVLRALEEARRFCRS